MKILITGNLGYIGPVVVRQLRTCFPEATIIGYDIGFFATNLINTNYLPECAVDIQYFGDVRNFPEEVLNGVDAIVALAAISNDPMGNKFEEVTMEINYKSNIELANKAKKMGVKRFVFASSCSVYGNAEDGFRTEKSKVNPLTTYAKSKLYTEEALRNMAEDNFIITCLRFATACGISERLRLDLVLNDFVAGAITSKTIRILSDGTPNRPLINVKDMAKAIEWAITRKPEQGGTHLVINTGSNEWNYQIKELAFAVGKIVSDTQIEINKNARADKRSYKVSFDLFKKLAPKYQPCYDLISTVKDLKNSLEEANFNIKNYRKSNFIRLKTLEKLVANKLLDKELRWTFRSWDK